MSKVLAAIISVCVLGVIGYLVFFPPCRAEDQLTHSFIVNREYREVIRVLAKQDSLEAIVSMSDGRIIDRQWESLNLDIDRIMRPVWRVNGSARFLIEITNPDGKIVLELYQQIHVNQDFMDVSMTLIRPADGVEIYTNLMHVQAEGEQTRFTVKNHIAMTKRIPVQYHDYMKEQVRQANMTGVQNTETCIRKYCQRSGLISIPLK